MGLGGPLCQPDARGRNRGPGSYPAAPGLGERGLWGLWLLVGGGVGWQLVLEGDRRDHVATTYWLPRVGEEAAKAPTCPAGMPQSLEDSSSVCLR